MPTPVSGQVGPAVLSDGVTTQPFYQEKTGGMVVQELHGKLYEVNYRGNLYSGGMTTTSISNVTFTTGTLGATCTPITGVWNPTTSNKNLVIVQATLGVTMTALQNTGCGAFMWCTAIAQSALTLGSLPLNRKSLVQLGSVAKDMSGIALTGLSGNLSIRNASSLVGGSSKALAELDTAVGMTTTMSGPGLELIDGAFIIPPGGVLALLCTTTPVAHSAASGIVWEEVPV